jgi:hypothetical protein
MRFGKLLAEDEVWFACDLSESVEDAASVYISNLNKTVTECIVSWKIREPTLEIVEQSRDVLPVQNIVQETDRMIVEVNGQRKRLVILELQFRKPAKGEVNARAAETTPTSN